MSGDPGGVAEGGNVRILVCDDNEAVRTTLVRSLKYKRGIEVLGEASTVEELIELLPRTRPDVVVLDVNMPGMTGVEGIKRLRDAGDNTPVVILSADLRNKVPAETAGAASFFYKGSTDIAELIEGIRAAGRT